MRSRRGMSVPDVRRDNLPFVAVPHGDVRRRRVLLRRLLRRRQRVHRRSLRRRRVRAHEQLHRQRPVRRPGVRRRRMRFARRRRQSVRTRQPMRGHPLHRRSSVRCRRSLRRHTAKLRGRRPLHHQPVRRRRVLRREHPPRRLALRELGHPVRAGLWMPRRRLHTSRDRKLPAGIGDVLHPSLSDRLRPERRPVVPLSPRPAWAAEGIARIEPPRWRLCRRDRPALVRGPRRGPLDRATAGDPNETRTRVTGVRGQCPNH